MAYNESIAERVTAMLLGQPDLTQKQMFGGISFMLQGNFCCGVVKDDLCVRVGKDAYEEALVMPHAREMDFTGRPMPGWVFVASPGLETDDELRRWVESGVRHALSLPAK